MVKLYFKFKKKLERFIKKVFKNFNVVRQKIFYIPFIFFSFSLIFFLYVIFFGHNIPYIKKIYPEVSKNGDRLEILGKNFTKDKLGASVYFSDIKVEANLIMSWENDKVVVKIPDDIFVGNVFIKTRYGKSNGKFWTNSSLVPQKVEESVVSLGPKIEKINLSKIYFNSALKISGQNFLGDSINEKIIIYDKNIIYEFELDSRNILEWNKNGITFLVPQFYDEDVFIKVKNIYGESNSVSLKYFSSGEDSFSTKKEYQFSVQTTIKNIGNKNLLYVFYFPMVQDRIRNIDLKNSDNHSNRYFSKDNILRADKSVEIKHNYKILSSDLSVKIKKDFYYTKNLAVEDIQNNLPIELPSSFMVKNISDYKKGEISTQNYILKLSTEIKNFINNSDSYNSAMIFKTFCNRVSIECSVVYGIKIFADNKVVEYFWNRYGYPEYGYINIDALNGNSDNLNYIPENYINFTYSDFKLPRVFAVADYFGFSKKWTNLEFFIQTQMAEKRVIVDEIKFLVDN